MTRSHGLFFAIALAACGCGSGERPSGDTVEPGPVTEPTIELAESAPPIEPATVETVPAGPVQTASATPVETVPAEPAPMERAETVAGPATCDDYGAHMAQMLARGDMFPTTIGPKGFAENCRDGEVSQARIDCVMSCDTIAEVSRCAGL